MSETVNWADLPTDVWRTIISSLSVPESVAVPYVDPSFLKVWTRCSEEPVPLGTDKEGTPKKAFPRARVLRRGNAFDEYCFGMDMQEDIGLEGSAGSGHDRITRIPYTKDFFRWVSGTGPYKRNMLTQVRRFLCHLYSPLPRFFVILCLVLTHQKPLLLHPLLLCWFSG